MSSNGPVLADIPPQNLLTFLFREEDQSKDEVVWRDAKDPNNLITRYQARNLVRRLAHGYISRNILDTSSKKPQYVITVTENQPLGFVHVLAIMASGAVVATCPSQASVREILFRIDLLRPRAVVCSRATIDLVKRAKSEARREFLIIVHDTPSMTVYDENGTSVISHDEQEISVEWDQNIATSPAAIVFSSGTTGTPKGVCISQQNIISMICQLRQLWAPILQQKKKPMMLGSLDNAHAAGLFLNTFCGLGVGLETVLAPASDIDLVLKAFRDHPIALFPTVPAVLQRILASPSFSPKLFEHIDFACTGAAKASDEVKAAFSQALRPGVLCQEAWGMTELTFLATMHSPGVPGPMNSIGKPLAGNKIEVRDVAQRAVAANCEGEIFVSGPTITPGYISASNADHQASREGWFRTGDMGRIDEQGYVYVTGRNKELIKYNGAQIAPVELESICRTLDFVLDVAVVGAETPDGNELPTAIVVLDETAPATALAEIAATVSQIVSPYKRLRGGVHAVKAIPRNAMGKPLLGELKSMATTLYTPPREKARM